MFNPAEDVARATLPTVRSVDLLAVEAPQDLKAVFFEIRDHFCEVGFTVGKLRERLGANKWLFAKFRRHAGLTPWQLIQELRMEFGMRLLRDSSLYVKDVAYFVGYEEFGNFSLLCQRWCGLTPAGLREQLRRVKGRLRILPEDALTWGYWRRAVSGQLSGEEARRLLLYLEGNLRG